jgi:hypothetical protein
MKHSLWLAAVMVACSVGARSQAPPNDFCASAAQIGEGTFTASTATATSEPLVCVQIAQDVWYRYTPSATGVTLFSTCPSDGGAAAFTTVIDLYSGACGALTLISCNYGTFGCGNGTRLYLEVTAGTAVYVRLGGMPLYLPVAGTFTLVVALTPAPANDLCTAAIPLGPGLNGPFSNAGATTGQSVVSPCSYLGQAQWSGGAGDVWFSWTATCGSIAKLQLCAGSLVGYATVHSACGGPPLTCVTSNTCGNYSAPFTAAPGTTYLIRVASLTSQYAYGSFSLQLSCQWQVNFAAPFGPGSISLQSTSGTPLWPYFTAITLLPQPYGPPGWFFGLDIPFAELFLEFGWPGGLPFRGVLDAAGDSPLSVVPAGVPPGLVFHAVSVHLDPVTGDASMPTPVKSFVTP